MDKKDWKEKEKAFREMLKKAKNNRFEVEKQIEELQVFLKAIEKEIVGKI